MFGKGRSTEKKITRDEKAAREAEKTLGQMGWVPAQAPPFFYTRLKARVDSTRTPAWKRWVARQLRPALVMTGVSLLLLVNIYCVMKASEQRTEVQRQQAAASIAEDYEFSTSQY